MWLVVFGLLVYGTIVTLCGGGVWVLEAEIACELECSHGEDYRLLNLTIIDFYVCVCWTPSGSGFKS